MENLNLQKQKIGFVIFIAVFLSFPVFSDTISGIKAVGQDRSEWCWAAVCECLVKFYDKSCTKTQAEIASVLTTENIAVHPDSIPRCLTVNGQAVNLQVEYIKSTIPWKDVKKEADDKHPFYYMIKWSGGGETNYHSNVFCGYLNDSNKLKFMDPGGPNFTFRTWAGALNLGSGTWWHTYKLKPGVSIVLDKSSFTQANNSLRIIKNPLLSSGKGVTIIFDDKSNDSRVLRIYNALGKCVYESIMDRDQTQLSWGVSNTISSGKYFVLHGHKKNQGFTGITKTFFNIIK